MGYSQKSSLLGEIGEYSGDSVKCLCRSVCSLCSETLEIMCSAPSSLVGWPFPDLMFSPPARAQLTSGPKHQGPPANVLHHFLWTAFSSLVPCPAVSIHLNSLLFLVSGETSSQHFARYRQIYKGNHHQRSRTFLIRKIIKDISTSISWWGHTTKKKKQEIK